MKSDRSGFEAKTGADGIKRYIGETVTGEQLRESYARIAALDWSTNHREMISDWTDTVLLANGKILDEEAISAATGMITGYMQANRAREKGLLIETPDSH